MELKLRIDRNSRIPIQKQIRDRIEQLIYQGILAPGKKLPPSRRLAASLGVNRSTVIAVYEDLIAEDLLTARVGSGTMVASGLESRPKSIGRRPINWSDIFSLKPRFEPSSLIRDTLAICAQPGMIMFANGVPSPRLYPRKEFREIFNGELLSGRSQFFDLMPSGGYPPLLELLAREAVSAADPARVDEIMITSGSIQGLTLISNTLLTAGDLVLVENPTFFGALQSFNAVKARLLFIPTDRNGMNIDFLEQILVRQRPKLLYTIPTFQNPSGYVLSLERRRRLLALAHRHSLPIVEDDPYSRIYFQDPPPPSLKFLDRFNHVIHISTFSKLLFPGLRVGWLQAPRQVIERLSRTKLLYDLHTNTPGQVAIQRYLSRGLLEEHLSLIRSVYAEKMGLMAECLGKYCAALEERQQPAGGYYFWCRLPQGLSSRELMLELFREGVAILPGEAFYPGNEGRSWFRLNFTFPDHDQIVKGIKIIGKVLNRLS